MNTKPAIEDLNHCFSNIIIHPQKQLMKRDLLYPNILVTVKGYDAAVLDHFCQFIQSGGHIFDLDVTKK